MNEEGLIPAAAGLAHGVSALLARQLYRAWSILANHPYHREWRALGLRRCAGALRKLANSNELLSGNRPAFYGDIRH